ncbi:hypothetical protein GCM10026982_31180 [Nocardiopsis aegyptia]
MRPRRPPVGRFAPRPKAWCGTGSRLLRLVEAPTFVGGRRRGRTRAGWREAPPTCDDAGGTDDRTGGGAPREDEPVRTGTAIESGA